MIALHMIKLHTFLKFLFHFLVFIFLSNMTVPRYFVNPAEDYCDGKVFAIDFKRIKSDIMEKVYICVEEQKKVHKGIEGGLYVGTYGNAYTLYYLSKKSRFAAERKSLINAAAKLIKVGLRTAARYKSKDLSIECGFLEGKAGIYALGAVIFYELGGEDEIVAECIKQYINVGSYCGTLSYANFGGDEFFIGRAGYLCGALWLNHYFGRQVICDPIIHKICDLLIQSGKEYSRDHHSKFPLMYHYYNTEYLGAAHGICTILLLLLKCESYLAANEEFAFLVKDCIDRLVNLQMPNGNFPPSIDEIGVDRRKDELVHWCHGGPGVFYLMMKSFLKWHEPKYLDAALKIGELVWEKGLLKKGPGICHGVAGNGYVFLMLYRATGSQEVRYLYRANEFAKFMRTTTFKTARVPDNPFSLFEGLAGTICFLADLMEPETATFPFMEIM